MRVYRSGPPAGADVLALGKQRRCVRLVQLFDAALAIVVQLGAITLSASRSLHSAIETQERGALRRASKWRPTPFADLDRRLGQIDTAIEEAAKRGKTNTALSADRRPAQGPC
jgi:hypothetical protein